MVIVPVAVMIGPVICVPALTPVPVSVAPVTKGVEGAEVTVNITVKCKQSRDDTTWVDLTKMGGGHRYGLELVKTDKGWKIIKADITE